VLDISQIDRYKTAHVDMLLYFWSEVILERKCPSVCI